MNNYEHHVNLTDPVTLMVVYKVFCKFPLSRGEGAQA